MCKYKIVTYAARLYTFDLYILYTYILTHQHATHFKDMCHYAALYVLFDSLNIHI